MELAVTGELSPARSNTVCWLAPKELSEEKSYRSCPEVKSTQFLSSNVKKITSDDEATKMKMNPGRARTKNAEADTKRAEYLARENKLRKTPVAAAAKNEQRFKSGVKSRIIRGRAGVKHVVPSTGKGIASASAAGALEDFDAEHVCHLFSHRFGGAFHEWNYLFMSASMNVSFGSFHGKLLPAPFPAANRHSRDPAVPQIRSCAISQVPSELRWPSKLRNT
jgi:hypothetical protein